VFELVHFHRWKFNKSRGNNEKDQHDENHIKHWSQVYRLPLLLRFARSIAHSLFSFFYLKDQVD
jgi:hypothetical protein